MTLTREQVEEGRRRLERDEELSRARQDLRSDRKTVSGGKLGSRLHLEDWLWEHRAALLVAAEAVARSGVMVDEAKAFPTEWPPPELGKTHELAWKAFEDTLRARHDLTVLGIHPDATRRIRELEPEAAARFGASAVVLERFVDGGHDEDTAAMINPKAVTLGEIERWYEARGLRVRLKLVGDQLMYDFVGLIEPVDEDQPDGHAKVRVR